MFSHTLRFAKGEMLLSHSHYPQKPCTEAPRFDLSTLLQQVMYNRILAFTKRSTEEQEQQLVSLPEYRFISVLSGELAPYNPITSSLRQVPGVSSYSIKRLSVDEADKLDKGVNSVTKDKGLKGGRVQKVPIL
eukprot:1161681-Pelagomonas_calceolata.AAC.5